VSNATISSIERTAAQLDNLHASRLKTEAVDFDGYMKARSQDDAALVKQAKSFSEELHDEFFGEAKHTGLDLPWVKVRDHWRMRPGEVSLWLGFNGHMKSMVQSYVALGVMEQGAKVGIASFEMKPRRTLKRMACQAIGTVKPTPLYIDKFLDYIEGKVFLYDQQGTVTPQRIVAVITYCAEVLGITVFLVDSLMKVVADEDDYNGQKRFIDQMCSLARDLNIHIHIVHHSRKREDESKRPGKQDAKGTGATVDQVDNCVTVFKLPTKKDGDPTAPTHVLYLDKQRNGEWEGAVSLHFKAASLQFHEHHMERTKHWVS
jgi:twinkle protein